MRIWTVHEPARNSPVKVTTGRAFLDPHQLLNFLLENREEEFKRLKNDPSRQHYSYAKRNFEATKTVEAYLAAFKWRPIIYEMIDGKPPPPKKVRGPELVKLMKEINYPEKPL